jgi:hypothetical protein
MDLQKDKYVTQHDIAEYTGKARQWISYLVSVGRLDSEFVLGKKVIVVNQKLMNFLKESGK